MELHIYKTADETIKGLADFFADTVNAAIETNGKCAVVLSGGNSPKKLYELLASAAYSDKIPWSKIFFFFGDERNVPFTDKDNNGLMAKQSLFEPLNIDKAKIFYINTSLGPDEAAADYAKKIQWYFGKDPIRFDLVLLGLGDNAHTASLFPHTKVLYEMKKLVSAVYIEEINAYRITMTAPLINESAAVAFLVYGESKAPAVFNILEGEKNIERYPAQLIDLSEGAADWFLDEAAAALLVNRPH